jgi:ATP-dependent exoDNAse (exonuclease V) beta subunit
MTIHGAKGLEFDTVVLADLDRGDFGRRAPMFVVGRDGDGEIDRVVAYPSAGARALEPRLAEMYESTLEGEIVSELSVLYVAITRAKSRLRIIVPPTKERKDGGITLPNNLAGVLRAALVGDAPLEAGSVAWKRGDEDALTTPPAATTRGPDGNRRTVSSSPRLAEGAASGALVAASGGEQTHGDRVRRALVASASLGADIGTATHAIMERIEWLDGPASLPDAQDGTPEATAAHIVRTALASPAVRAMLDRDAAIARLGGESVDVERERPVLIATGRGVLAGRFDRIVVAREGGRPVACEVIDYKTDSCASDEDARAIAVRYAAQMAAYRQAAATLYELAESKVRVWLVILGAGRVVEC